MTPSNASEAFNTALRLLGRSDHSEAELRTKLKRYKFSSKAIDAAIASCHEYNYLNDQRYAEGRARSLVRNGRAVGPRLRLELRKRGISGRLAEQACEQAEAETPAEESLRELLERRFGDFDYDSADDKQRRRVVSFFQRRGFTLSQIFSVVKGG